MAGIVWCPGRRLTDEPRVNSDLDTALGDPDLAGILVDRDRLADETLRDRVAHRVDADEAVQIDDALEHLVDRWQNDR